MILLAVSNRDEIFPKVLPILSFPRVIPLVRRYMIGLAITQQLLQIFSIRVEEGASVHIALKDYDD